MKKQFRFALVALMAIVALGTLIPTLALAQPRQLDNDAFTRLTRGYDQMQAGKYEAAEAEFKDALKMDRYNPFALNNLAAIAEKNGKLKDAMAYLVDAKTHAKEYVNKVQQTCFVGGLCAAVKPEKVTGTESTIAPVIAENILKLEPKIKALPPEPTAPPAKK